MEGVIIKKFCHSVLDRLTVEEYINSMAREGLQLYYVRSNWFFFRENSEQRCYYVVPKGEIDYKQESEYWSEARDTSYYCKIRKWIKQCEDTCFYYFYEEGSSHPIQTMMRLGISKNKEYSIVSKLLFQTNWGNVFGIIIFLCLGLFSLFLNSRSNSSVSFFSISSIGYLSTAIAMLIKQIVNIKWMIINHKLFNKGTRLSYPSSTTRNLRYYYSYVVFSMLLILMTSFYFKNIFITIVVVISYYIIGIIAERVDYYVGLRRFQRFREENLNNEG